MLMTAGMSFPINCSWRLMVLVGHDDALAVGGGVQHRRQQVGDALADAGAAFDDELAALVDGAGDGFEHLGLLGPGLEVGEGCGKDAVGGEQVLDLLLGKRTADGVGGRAVVGWRGRALGEILEQNAGDAAGVSRPTDSERGGVAAGGVGNQSLQQVGHGGVGGAGGAGNEGDFGGGLAGGDFQKAVEYLRGGFGVAQGPGAVRG